MDGFAADLQHALRVYAKTPIASGLAVLMLAAALAVVTGFLSIFSALALKPARGFADGGDLVTILQTDGTAMQPLAYRLVERAAEEMASVEAFAGVLTVAQSFDEDGQRRQLYSELVTAEYFPGLRPRLQLGRGFEPEDHALDAAPVVVISDAFWRARFGGRPDVLGETLRIRGPDFVFRTADGEARPGELLQDHRVVGVMAPALPGTFFTNDVWVPFEQAAEFLLGGAGPTYRGLTLLRGVARRAPGASVDAVGNELAGRYGDTERDELGVYPEMRLDVIGGVVGSPDTHRQILRQVRLFLAGSVLLALVAACNVSLFLLSRAPGRRRELAIRLAVGAPRKRLARQLVTEAGLIGSASMLLALLGAVWLAAAMTELPFLLTPLLRDVTLIDWRVLAGVAAFTLLLTATVALAPVAGLRRLSLAAGTRAVSARASVPQRIAGFAQIFVATLIAGVAGAFLWYLAELGRVSPGFGAPDVYLAQVQPPAPPGDIGAIMDAALVARERRRETLLSIPGVDAVAFGTTVPGLSRQMGGVGIEPPDGSEQPFRADLHTVDSEYLGLLGSRLLGGRFLAADDRDAVVVNRALAERTWGRTNVVGEILPGGPGGPRGWEIVGVVENIAYGHPGDDPEPMVFHTRTQSAWWEWPLLRSSLSPAELRQAIQDKIDAGELELTVYNVRGIDAAWRALTASDRSRMGLTVAAAAFVALLAAFGYYGTQRFLVASGRREYAILAALGAGPKALGRLVIGRGLAFGLPGLVFGALAAFIAVAWLRGDFVSATVPPFAVAALATLAMASMLVAAALGPARHARRTEPGPLLKEE